MGGPSSGSSSGGNTGPANRYKTPAKKAKDAVVDYIKGGGVVGAVVRGLKNSAKKSKQNVLDYEGQAAGVTPERKPFNNPKNDGGNDNNNQPTIKSVEQPKVKSQMDNTDVKSDLITADKTAPTEAETTESADDILLKNKKKGRKKTILTSVTGVDDYPTLSKKTLLGG
jgi:hypothetical protein